MKLVKKFMAIAACLAIATASMGIVVSASSKTLGTIEDVLYRPYDFLSYSANYRGTFSMLVVAPAYSAFGISNENYYGSYKFLSYETKQISDTGTTVQQYYGVERSTARNPVCYMNGVPDAATLERIYKGRLYETSSQYSSLEDSYIITIYK